jgi:membrane associated rhomboid family serine protease
MATTQQITIDVYADDDIDTQHLSMKDRVVIFVKRFPWFLFAWTIVLLFVFVYIDKDKYSYGCHNGMFYWKLMTYHMIHLNVKHIVYNLIAFWLFGLYVSFVYNDLLNIVIYAIGVIASGCSYYIECTSLKSDNEVIGASGGICAIIGAVFVISVYRLVSGFQELEDRYDTKEKLIYTIKTYIFSVECVFNVIALVSYDVIMFYKQGDDHISHTGHFGGYVSGVLCGLFIVINDAYIKNANK